MGVGYLGYPSHARKGGGMSTSRAGAKAFILQVESAVSPFARRCRLSHAAVVAFVPVIPAIGAAGAGKGWPGRISPLSSQSCRTA